MIIEVSIAVAVFVFAVLVFFAVRTLLSLQGTLNRLQMTIIEMEIRMKNLDSSLRSLSNIGDICENETEKLKRNYLDKRLEKNDVPKVNLNTELAEWLVMSLRLGNNFLKRR